MYSKSAGYKYLFGPVPSRRLGRSLGIDIIPHKMCTLNCIYCEVGRTTDCFTDRRRFYDPDDIISEFRDNYDSLKDGLDIVTVTGAGEPTLNSDLGYIIRELKKISSVPVGVLTNSTLFTDINVQNELLSADVVVPSIDAATPDIYKKICAPHRSLDIQKINESVIEFSHRYQGRLLIEILLCEGVNDDMDELGRIADIVSKCRYDIVQLNTVLRPPAFSRAKGVSPHFLLEAALMLKSRGIKVEPVGNYIREFSGGTVTEEQVKRLITMRPCSVRDMAAVFGVDETQINDIIGSMDVRSLDVSNLNGEDFYFMK